MSFTTVNIPSNASVIPVDTRTLPKVVYLPTVSTNAGRYLLFKDYYGTATNSTITISTTGTDLLDDYNPRYTFSNAFGSIGIVSDGIRSWRMLNLYNGALTPAPTSTFLPTSIAGGFLWLDASLLSGSSVTTFPSATPSYTYFMTGTGSVVSNGLNGKNVLGVTTAQNWSINASFSVSSWSFFFVSRQTGGVNRRVFIGDGNKLYGYWGGYKNQLYQEGWNTPQSPVSDTSWDLYSIVEQNSSAGGYFYRFGSNIATWTSAYTLPSFIYINTGGSFGGETSDAQIAEMIMYNTVVAPADARKIEGYLAWKWGLQASLSNGHPYQNAPP
jgi:hypothetical protein